MIAVTADDSWETSKRMRMGGEPILFYALKPLDLRQMQSVVQWVVGWSRRRQQRNKPGRCSTAGRGD